MPIKRMLLEIGMGNDLHGGDYSKAALRAVQDAVHHSSLSFVRSLGLNKNLVEIDVTIGVQKPNSVNSQAIVDYLPIGKVKVKTVKGGLYIPDPAADDVAVVATAAVEVSADIP